jgi:hypothetical protein
LEPQGAPGRSLHAQRAQRSLPEPEACPAPRRISVQARPHRLRSKRDATRLPGAAGRCGAVVLGHGRARWPSAERRARAAQAARVVGAAPPPMTPQHEAAGAVVRPARRSTVRGARTPPERGRCVAHWRSDGTRAPQTGAAAREGVLLVCFRGGYTRKWHSSSASRRNAMPSTPQGSARRPNPTKPSRHARPRQVHVGVGWIPPLVKAPSNDTRPCPYPYEDAPN